MYGIEAELERLREELDVWDRGGVRKTQERDR